MTVDQSRPWWQTAVIYQIYPRSFRDSNGDGIGDLNGVIDQLPYLSDTLGVDAIWLSPFFTSPMKDFGYDVADFTDVDPLFGTLADAERLIEAIHDQGMRVIFDYVPNHSSDQHPWFLESRSSRDAAKRNWYIWRDPVPGPDGVPGPPNNWLSVFGGPAWTFDEATGQYYLHSFLSSQPDLNWRNPDLRAAMYDVLKTWIDRGVDGFRVDAAHFVGKDEAMRDNPPAPPGSHFMHRLMGEYDKQLHLYDKGTAFTHKVYQDLRAEVDRYAGPDRDILLVGEMHIFDWDEWASYFGPTLNEFHLPYNFGLLGVDWTKESIASLIQEIERVLPEGAWPNWVLGNHDEPRIATRLGSEQARAAMVLLLTLRGTPTIYYGDELGMIDAEVPPERRQDPWGLQVTDVDVSRDPQRSPMLWTAERHGGFTAPDAEPWLPTVDPSIYSVEAQIDQPRSMLNLTRTALELRKQRRSLRDGVIRLLDDLPENCLGYVREEGTEASMVLISFADDDVEIDLGPATRGLLLLSSRDVDVSRPFGGILRLKPYEALVAAIEM